MSAPNEDNMDIEGIIDLDEMPPPPSRAPQREQVDPDDLIDMDDLESESSSAAEQSIRAHSTSSAGKSKPTPAQVINGVPQSFNGQPNLLLTSPPRRHRSRSDSMSGEGSSSKRRRRRSHSRSESASQPLGANAGVYRDRISSASQSESEPLVDTMRSAIRRPVLPAGDPAPGAAAAPLPAAVPRPAAEEMAIAREAMHRAGVSPEDAVAALEESMADMSIERRYAVPVERLYDTNACPICEEHASYVHRDAVIQLASAQSAAESRKNAKQNAAQSAQNLQARTAVSKQDIRKHEVLFKVEAELRGRISDKRLAVYLLRMRRAIERELEGAQIHYVKWTSDMITRHFDVLQGHMRDPVREMTFIHDTLIRKFPRMVECMFVPSMTQPGVMLLDVRAFKAVNDLVTLQIKTNKEIRELQNAIDPHATNTMRSLLAAINSYSQDDTASTITMDPEASAGGNPANAANAGTPRSIYEINGM
jgi:hypothetical protein